MKNFLQVNRASTGAKKNKLFKLSLLLLLVVCSATHAWGDVTWVRLDSVDFTNTTTFPAQTITGEAKTATTKTINGVFFTAKKKKKFEIK